MPKAAVLPNAHTNGERQSDLAFAQIKNDIILCRLKPGESVSEAELSLRYDCGRAATRAALTRLAETGLVTPRPRRGFVIAPITLKSVQDVFDLRLLLEPQVAAIAAGKVDADELRHINKQPQRAKNDAERIDFLDSNRAFHRCIAEATGNAKLVGVLDDLFDDITRLVHLGLYGAGRTAKESQADQQRQDQDHEDLISAFEAQDPLLAEKIARAHIEHSRDLALRQILNGNVTVNL